MHTIGKLVATATLVALTSTAQGACTSATLKGVWGFSYDTFRLADDGYCAGIGLMTFTPATNLGRDGIKISAQRGNRRPRANRELDAAKNRSIRVAHRERRSLPG